MNPQFTAEEIRKKYDGYAQKYDRILLAVLAEVLGVRKMRREMLKDAHGDILEVAVGTGKNLNHYPVNGCRITAVDMSREMLAVAKSHAGKTGLNVTFCVMNAQQLAVPDGAFSTVLTSCSLCTFPEPVTALKELARVCKKDGRLLLLEHGRSSNERVERWMDRKAEKNAEILGCYWNREPLALIRQAGLTIVTARRFLLGMFHMVEAKP